jgi:hypothetical protein
VKACQEGGFNALHLVSDSRMEIHKKLFARDPLEVAKDLAINLFGEKGEEVV